MSLIALLTDFGDEDWYVSAMKAAIYKLNPSAKIIDISHKVKPYDITGGAFLLSSSESAFPDKTIFCCVVDPGVGSNRDIICATDGRSIYIAPNNGLLELIYKKSKNWRAFQFTNYSLIKNSIGKTFHGRDIMGPLSALLSSGTKLEETGEKCDYLVTSHIPEPIYIFENKTIELHILYIDHFGNLITNLHSENFKQSGFPIKKSCEYYIMIDNKKISGFSETFSEKNPGDPLFYWGSSGNLEIAVNLGRANNLFSINIGDRILLMTT